MKSQKSGTELTLIIAALGVVFGDIGTSPLYTLREAFTGHGGLDPSAFNVLGVLSLIIWTIVLIVSLKYLLFVMKADNKGEGGILALTALISSLRPSEGFRRAPILLLGLFGAALLFSDGVLTPAVTVLAAVEGLQIATPLFKPVVVPIAITILVLLFWAQHYGSARIGLVFGPVITVWFSALAVLGISGVLKAPEVLQAFNPIYGIEFALQQGWHIVHVLGAVFLAVTGAEALYADMGHFGPSPIRKGWYYVAFPALILNYLGQGALIITDPTAITNPFYFLVPSWALYPMVILATCAAVIASQALISGVFSITQQAIHLGYLPRIRVVHTSDEARGQIYMPHVNWALLTFTVWLTIEFKSSSALASAYGIAVSLTMLITTFLACLVAYRMWKLNPIVIGIGFVLMMGVDLIFFFANSLKIHDGGWFPLALASVLFLVTTTWKTGRIILFEYMKSHTIPFDTFVEQIQIRPPAKVPGTAIFMTAETSGIPLALLHNVKHNKVLHQKNIFLTIRVEEVPYVKKQDRLEITKLKDGFSRWIAHYGFMEKPDVRDVFDASHDQSNLIKMEDVSFFLGKETIIATHNRGMAIWREKLFSFMTKNSEAAIIFFNIPRHQVVELGVQIEL
ncbi:MAG: potassium transporter Kup [Bdellovibrionales bacterium]|nr:potassium transporter Kup [Bdellovibrionales bacterium]